MPLEKQQQALLQQYEGMNQEKERTATMSREGGNVYMSPAMVGCAGSDGTSPLGLQRTLSDGDDSDDSAESDSGSISSSSSDRSSPSDPTGKNSGHGEHDEESVARLTIRSLLHHLPLCADAKQVLVGDLYLESVFPAYMLNALVLQHVALSSVIHSIKHGLSGNEGFSFAMSVSCHVYTCCSAVDGT